MYEKSELAELRVLAIGLESSCLVVEQMTSTPLDAANDDAFENINFIVNRVSKMIRVHSDQDLDHPTVQHLVRRMAMLLEGTHDECALSQDWDAALNLCQNDRERESLQSVIDQYACLWEQMGTLEEFVLPRN